jgi:hypothetical protein
MPCRCLPPLTPRREGARYTQEKDRRFRVTLDLEERLGGPL